MMVANVNSCPERDRYVIVLMDEMHIKSDLVYDKHSGKYTNVYTIYIYILCTCVIHVCTSSSFLPNMLLPGSLIGFTHIGEVNGHLQAFEHSLDETPLAQSMLVLMVRGLFCPLEFAYAQFPCNELSGDQIYEPFWEAVSRLERCGFRVMALVCDGLAANRRLFRLHNPGAPAAEMYKVVNPYSSDGRPLFFLSDPPHLLKTVRNAWASNKRSLWVSWVSNIYTCNVSHCYM